MKIELSVKVDYLPTWDAYCGVRELIQNAKDATVEFNATMEVRYRKETQTLAIENEGCVLPHEALLIGHTTKAQRSDTAGKYGEGLKFGSLALIRAGHSVKIRSGSEVWIPSIQKSEKFNADVLVFDIEKGRSNKNRVQVEIGGIEPEAWEQMQKCFLFLLKAEELNKICIETSYGSLLIGEAYVGKLFVKGIFVQIDSNMKYGYNFNDAEVDRDRKMVAKWDLQYKCRLIWSEAANKRPDLMGVFVTMLDQQAQDLDGIDNYSAQYLPEQVKAEVVRSFQERHGQDALPVSTLSESKDIEHLGRKGIVASKSLRAVLETKLGTVDQVKVNLKREVVRVYSWCEIGETERANLETSIALINKVSPLTLNDIDVAEFRDEKTLGLWKDNRISVAYKMLAQRETTMRCTVHEFAHKLSHEGDGTKDHVECMELLWAGIVEILLKGQSDE